MERDDHERMGDPAVAYEGGDAGERGGLDLDLLVAVTRAGTRSIRGLRRGTSSTRST